MDPEFNPRFQSITPEQLLKQVYSLTQPPTAPRTKRGIIYIRKSRMLRGETAYSPAEQESACRAYAASQGMEVVDAIQDLDKSGRNSDRDGFQRLLRKIKAGEVDYVLVQYLDREFRNGMSFIQFYDLLQKYGVQFVSVNEQLDTRSFTGRFMLFVLAVAAELPVWNASERVRAAKRARREKGLHNGGYRLGYCNGLCSTCTDPNGAGYCLLYGSPESQRGRIQSPHPVEQHAVRLIAHEYAAGKSAREIAEYLNTTQFQLPENGPVVQFRTKGVPGFHPPGEFQPSSILDIIRNPFYAGFVSHHPTPDLNMNDNIENPKAARVGVKNRRAPDELHQGQHAALISVDLWQKNLLILRAKGNRTPKGEARKKKRAYLLAGIGRCAECRDQAAPGHPIHLRGTPNGSGRRVYRCANAASRRIDPTPAIDPATLGLHSQPSAAQASLHWSSLPAELLEDQAHELLKQLRLPKEWHEDILAYAASQDGPAAYKRQRYNLIRELERYKAMCQAGLLDLASLKTNNERIGGELRRLDPRIDPRLRTLIPLLADFASLWEQMTPQEQHSLLKRMFQGLYFDGEGRLVEARAYAPFDRLLGLTET
mgnify:CR=1 FL=1